MAELVAAVAGCIRFHALGQAIARKNLGELIRSANVIRPAQQCRHIGGVCHQNGPGNRRWSNTGITGILHLAAMAPCLGIAGQCLQKTIVECQLIEEIDVD